MTRLCIPEDALKQHVIVLGKTGSGKSSKLRVIVEFLLRHKKRVCIVDIKGDWWGLKSSADGKSAGFPVVAFGDFREPKAQDVPINAQSGTHVAELITSGNRPCIIGFRGWMPSQIIEFWIGNEANRWNGFASTLFNKNEGEIYVVISECHNFAPKGRVDDPRSGRVLHWTNRLITEGRGLGMTFLLDSQRPQKVHNDTLTSCETLVACRVIHPADRDAIAVWIKGCGDAAKGKEVLDSLASLDRTEAWVWSPEVSFGPERIQFPMFTTFDSFAPAQLQGKVHASGWSTVDLEAVKQRLAKVIEENKANDPTALRARVKELENQLKKAAASTQVTTGDESLRTKLSTRESEYQKLSVAVGELMKVVVEINAIGFEGALSKDQVESILRDASAKIVQVTEAAVVKRSEKLERLKRETLAMMAKVREVLKQDTLDVQLNVTKGAPKRFTARIPPKTPLMRPVHTATDTNGLKTSAVKALGTLCQWPDGLTEAALAAQLGLKARGGGWNGLKKSLIEPGYVVRDGRRLIATAEGRAFIGSDLPPTPRSTDEVLRIWQPVLKESAYRAIVQLRGMYPEGLTRTQLAESLGVQPRGGGWNSLLRELKQSGLMVSRGPDLFANKETLLL